MSDDPKKNGSGSPYWILVFLAVWAVIGFTSKRDPYNGPNQFSPTQQQMIYGPERDQANQARSRGDWEAAERWKQQCIRDTGRSC